MEGNADDVELDEPDKFKNFIITSNIMPKLMLKLKDKKLQTSLSLEEKIAVRVPDNKCLGNLLKESKFLIGTSANVSGKASLTKSKDCFQKIKGFDVFLDGGDIENKGESTIVEIEDEKPIFHRIGKLKKEEILGIF